MTVETKRSAAVSAAQGTAVAVLAAISVCHMLNDVIQSLIMAIYPMLKENLALNFHQIGLITFTFQFTASVLQPVVGYFTDRYPTPYSLVIGMGSSLVGLILIAFATSYLFVLAAAALIGMGSSVFHPESSRVARLASGGHHGLAQSVFQVGGNFGTALGPLFAAFIVLPYGQRTIIWFSLVALIGMVLLAIIGTWYGKTLKLKRVSMDEEREAMAKATHGKVARSIAILMALTFSKHFYLVSITSFYIFYLIHTFGISVQNAQLHLFLFLAAVAAGTVIRRPHRRPHRLSSRDLVVDPRRAAVHAGSPLCRLVLECSAERDHRADPRLGVSRNPGLCASADTGSCRHGGRSVLWSCVRDRRHRRGGSRLARRCDVHRVRVSHLRFSSGHWSARGIFARDGQAETRAESSKEVTSDWRAKR